jgi:MFS family permease
MSGSIERRQTGEASARLEPSAPPVASRRAILVPLAAAQFLASYDSSSMNVAISNIVQDLDTTVTGVQSAISIFTLTMAALMIPGSKLTDIWGRKRCFRLGVTIYGLGALITSLAPTLGVMIIGFSILEGVGSALMIPPIYILVTVMIPDMASRAKAFAVVSAMAGLGAATGPLLGGFITTTISWRASFAGEVVAILGILYLSRRIPDIPVEEPKPAFDLTGAVLSAGGLVFIVLGLLQAGTYGWLTARKDFVIGDTVLLNQGDVSPVIIFVAIGLALLLLFAWHIRRRERANKAPLLSSRLFRNRTTVLGLVTQNSQWFIMIGTFFVVSVFLQMSRGYNAIETGLALTPATAGILISSARVETLVRKYSQRTIIRGGFVITFVGALLLLLLAPASSSVLAFVPGLLLIGFGAGIMLTASVNVVQSSVPESDQGELSGLSRSVSNLGSSLGTAVAGAILISALISGISARAEDSTVLTPPQQEQVAAALEGDVSAMSDAQIEELLQGQPQPVVDEVTQINSDARDRALGFALIGVTLVGLLGMLAAFLLPPGTAAAEDEASRRQSPASP